MKLIALIKIDLKKVLPWLLTLLLIMNIGTGFIFFNTFELNQIYVFNLIMNPTLTSDRSTKATMSIINFFNSVQFKVIIQIYMTTALAVICLSFYLWYKEWLGSSRRIYLLLTLKGSRFTIIISKLITSLLIMLLFYVNLLLNIGIGALLLADKIQGEVLNNQHIQEAVTGSSFIYFVLPTNSIDFIYKVLVTIFIFSIITVLVLSQFSKGIWGLFFSVGYLIGILTLLIRAKIIGLFIDNTPFINFSFLIVTTFISLGFSYWLLNKKIYI